MTTVPVDHIAVAFYDALFDTDRVRARGVIDSALRRRIAPEELVFSVVLPGIERMTESLVDRENTNLSQHFLASQICEEVIDLLLPLFRGAPTFQGTVVLGASCGDFHGLGKKIVRGCLRASLFSVIDLGINVEAERFVIEAVNQKAAVIGVSSKMVHTALSDQGPRRVRQLLRERGLEGEIKLIVGGAPYKFDPELYRRVGADAWGENGMQAVRVVTQLLGAGRP